LAVLGVFEDINLKALRVISTNGIDYVGVIKNGDVELIFCDDGVSYENLSPLQLVEYSFEQG